jgi:hypothetical protein
MYWDYRYPKVAVKAINPIDSIHGTQGAQYASNRASREPVAFGDHHQKEL